MARMPDMDDLLDALEETPISTAGDQSTKHCQFNSGLGKTHVQKLTHSEGMEAVLDALDQEDASSRTPTGSSIALNPPPESGVLLESVNSVLVLAEAEQVSRFDQESVTPLSKNIFNNMDVIAPPTAPVSSPNLTPPPTPNSTPANVDPSSLPIPTPPAPTPAGSMPESLRASPTTMFLTPFPNDKYYFGVEISPTAGRWRR